MTRVGGDCNPAIYNSYLCFFGNIMGGNALKLFTRRYEKEEFVSLVSKVIDDLTNLLNVKMAVIPYYTNKETFGDADILVESDDLPTNWINRVLEFYSLDTHHFKHNGDCLSIVVEELQVDLITTPLKYFKASLDYFSFNDLHNITGRIFHKLGIKHGHKGISLVIRHRDRSDHILDEIFLEHDDAKDAVYSILGLDPTFVPQNLEDIYQFVSSSKYFDPDIYLLENRNSTSRVRDKKRAVYRGMLEWCAAHPDSKKYSFAEKSERGGYSLREPYYTEIVLKKWPWVESKVNDLIAEFELNQKFAEVYNGKIVEERTGFSGKRLGAFMQRMKSRIVDSKTKQLWIDSPSVALLNIDSEYLQAGGINFALDL